MKNWKKPEVMEMRASQIAKYISAAARSTICLGREYR